MLFAVQLHWVSAIGQAVGRLVHRGLAELHPAGADALLCRDGADGAHDPRRAARCARFLLHRDGRLKGVRPARLMLHHALRNAAGPIANAVALNLSSLLGGVIIVEVIFSYPGLAKLAVDAVETRDMPLVQACAMIFCATFMLPGAGRRHLLDPLQSAAADPMSDSAISAPRRRRLSAAGQAGIALVLAWAGLGRVRPVPGALSRRRRSQCRRVRADECRPSVRHRLSRPRHAEPHPLRRPLHRGRGHGGDSAGLHGRDRARHPVGRQAAAGPIRCWAARPTR